MKLISWNCCLPPWSLTRGKRLPSIILSILGEDPDIICLQEIFFEKDADYLVKELGKRDFSYFFKFQDLFTISKVPIFFSKGIKFKDQGSAFSFALMDVMYGKALQVVGVETGKGKIFVANTHLLSAYALSGKKYQNVRKNQVKEMMECLKILSGGKVILTGDFNFKPGTEPYEILKDSGYADLSEQVPRTINTKKLDFIFAKNPPIKEFQIDSKFTKFSDHAFQVLEF